MIEFKDSANQISSSSPQKYTHKKLFVLQKNFENNDSKKKIYFFSRKVLPFFVEKKTIPEHKKLSQNQNSNEGKWSKEEHIKFLEAIIKYGINWKKVKAMVKTRTLIQIRSHAQKFFRKLKDYKDEKLGIDFTKKSIKNIRDLINHVKSLHLNYDLIPLLLHLTKKCEIQRKVKASFRFEIRRKKTKNESKNKIKKIDNNNTIIDNNNSNNIFFINNSNNINNNDDSIKNEKKENLLNNEEINQNQQINNINYIAQLNYFFIMNHMRNLYNFEFPLRYYSNNNRIVIYNINNNLLLNNYFLNRNNNQFNYFLSNSINNNSVINEFNSN